MLLQNSLLLIAGIPMSTVEATLKEQSIFGRKTQCCLTFSKLHNTHRPIIERFTYFIANFQPRGVLKCKFFNLMVKNEMAGKIETWLL